MKIFIPKTTPFHANRYQCIPVFLILFPLGIGERKNKIMLVESKTEKIKHTTSSQLFV